MTYEIDSQLISRILCGRFKILPVDLRKMSLIDVLIMLDAYNYCRYEDQDSQYKLSSWQTCVIVNACGKVKKKLRPQQLYKGIDVYKEFSKKSSKNDTKSYVENEKAKLKAIFNLQA